MILNILISSYLQNYFTVKLIDVYIYLSQAISMAMVALNFLSLLFMDEALPVRASVSEDK